MRRAATTFVGCAVLVVGLAGAIQAQPFRGMQDQLNLTEDQLAQIKELQEKHREAARAASAEIIKAEAEIQALMLDPDRDLTALERAMTARSTLQIEERIRELGAQKEYLGVLTDEQRALLDAREGTRLGRGVQRPMARQGRGLRGIGRSGRAGIRGRGLRDVGRGTRVGIRNQPMGRGRNIPPPAGTGIGTGPNRSRMGLRIPPDRGDHQPIVERRMETRRGAVVPPPSVGDR